MIRTIKLASLVLIAMLASACTVTAPRYSTNYSAVAELKSAGLAPAQVGKIVKRSGKQNPDHLSMRAASCVSPYGSFASYLQEALKDDLDHAELLNAQGPAQIEGALIRNVMDISGFTVGSAELEAQLVVHRGDLVVYDRTKSVRHEWRSNFLGDIAISRAMQNYPLAVRKLLAEFYADPEFVAALKRP